MILWLEDYSWMKVYKSVLPQLNHRDSLDKPFSLLEKLPKKVVNSIVDMFTNATQPYYSWQINYTLLNPITKICVIKLINKHSIKVIIWEFDVYDMFVSFRFMNIPRYIIWDGCFPSNNAVSSSTASDFKLYTKL